MNILRTLGLVALLTLPSWCWAQNPFSLSEADELELGRQAAVEIEKQIALIDDPAIVKFVDDLGQSLVLKSGRKDIRYSFKVVNSPEINAFALPGGHIYVNRGLLEAAQDEDELAGVLGHEIGHVVARHGAEQAARSGLVQNSLGILGSLLGKGPGASMSQIAVEMVAKGAFMKFSRQAERDADRLGARMLYDAGFAPRAMVSFFNQLAAIQTSRPNAVQAFFMSHPSPAERAANITDQITEYPANANSAADPGAFQDLQTRLTALPRPEVQAAEAAAAIAAAAQPPAEPDPLVRRLNLARDREIAAYFAPIFHQALGTAPRYDYITNFDFDGDWRGDNNWNNAEDRRFPLKAYVYFSVFETRTHFFIHYALFHPRDYKGGEKNGALLSELMRIGVQLGGQYDPTGRMNEAVMAHENDLEGALVVAEKNGDDLAGARLTLVETLAHNNYLKYTPPGSPLPGEPLLVESGHPHLFVEPKGHGIEAWRDDAEQHKQAENGFLTYAFPDIAEDPEAGKANSVGYQLLPVLDTLWPRARSGKDETFGEEHDYGILPVRLAQAEGEAEHYIRIGLKGSALNGVVGAANMSRPPWGWFDGQDRSRPLGEWFLQPAETIRRRWNLPESFSTTYTYHPFLGQFR
jgi:hypothetical protein